MYLVFRLLPSLLLGICIIAICARIFAHRRVGHDHGVRKGSVFFVMVAVLLMLVPTAGFLSPMLLPTSFFRPAPLILGFLLPSFLVAGPLIRRLETSGTSLVEPLEQALRDTRLLATLALIYFGLVWGVDWFTEYQLRGR